jgi:hypothetical protein
MPNTHSRSTPRKRQYYGEDKAVPLVEWLNSPGEPEAVNHEAVEESKARIVQIFDWLVELGAAGGDEAEKCSVLVAQINEVLRECAIVPYVWLLPGKKLSCALDLMPAPGSRHYAELTPREIGKTFIPFGGHAHLVMLIDLWRAGLISNLRRCKNCRKFLFQRFSHKAFCSETCREADKTSPTYKAKRNKRVSENRLAERLRDQRNRERSGRKR